MKTMHIKGPLLTQSGYGVHSRQIFRWAQSRGYNVSVEVTNWGITPWYLDPQHCDGLIGQVMECTKPIDYRPDYAISIQLPHEWNPGVGKKNIGVTAGVETNICSQQWINACKQMDAVIVPSRFAKQTFVNSGYEKISVVNECFYDSCIDSDVDGNTVEDELACVTTEKNFLIFGQITGPDSSTDRKNTFDTIKWFFEAYSDKDYGLIIKTNSGTNCTIDKDVTRKKLKNVIDAVRPQNAKAKLYFLHGLMTEAEVASLYKNEKITALISATRGEGFGLPLLEAAACKLPVIATNWSGHKDFLDLGDWLKVKKSLVAVPPEKIDGQIFVPGASWAQPDQKDFIKKINYLINNEKKVRKQANLLGDRVAEKFSFAKIAKDYDRFMESL